MKKLQILFIAISMSLIVASCHRGSHTIIQTNDDHNITRVEYTGRLIFSGDSKQIVSMSQNGYLKFTKNDQKLNVERSRTGQIIYEVNGEKESPVLNEDGQRLLSEAIQQITKAQGKRG